MNNFTNLTWRCEQDWICEVISHWCRSQMTHLLTWLPSWSQLSLPHFIGEHLMQQVCCSVVPRWPAQHICMSAVYLWCQDDLPNTFAWVLSICGVRMTCPTHLQEWYPSVVPGWPAQHISISGVHLWCQDDLPNTFASVVSIQPYIHPLNGNGNHFLYNKFTIFGLLCFSIFFIMSDLFPFFTSTHTHTHTYIYIYIYIYKDETFVYVCVYCSNSKTTTLIYYISIQYH